MKRILLLIAFISTGAYGALSDSLTITNNKDNTYSVLCQNMSTMVATADDIFSNRICPQVMLKEGYYDVHAGNTDYCDHRIVTTYKKGNLANITIQYQEACSGSTAELTCEDNVCSGLFEGETGRDVSIRITDESNYEYHGLSGNIGYFRFQSKTRTSPNRGVSPSTGDRK